MQIIFDLEVKEQFHKDTQILDQDGELFIAADVKKTEYTVREGGETITFTVLEPQNAKPLARFEHDALLRQNFINAVRNTPQEVK